MNNFISCVYCDYNRKNIKKYINCLFCKKKILKKKYCIIINLDKLYFCNENCYLEWIDNRNNII